MLFVAFCYESVSLIRFLSYTDNRTTLPAFGRRTTAKQSPGKTEWTIPSSCDLVGFTSRDGGNWVIRSNFAGGEREHPIHFLLQDKIVMGGGNVDTRVHNNYFSYNAENDSWEDFGVWDELAISQGAGFAIGREAYVISGRRHYTTCDLTNDCGYLNTYCERL